MNTNKSYKPNNEPMITRTIKVAYYKVRVWNESTEQMETREEKFFDNVNERDIRKVMESRLASESPDLCLVKLSKQGVTVYNGRMTLEKFFNDCDKEVVKLDNAD